MLRLLSCAVLLLAGCGDATLGTATDADTTIIRSTDVLAGDSAPLSAAEAGEDASVLSAAEAGEGTAPISAVEAGEDAAPASEAKTTDRPETTSRSVSVEGEASMETLRLATFPSFPVPFSTYLRPGVTVEQPGSGDAIAFESGAARVLVTVPYESVDAAITRMRAALPGAQSLEGAGAWARDGFYLYQGDIVTTVRIGEHDGTTFVVEESMPAEMGDGFSPTVEVLLDEWLWADGTPL